MKMLMSGRLSTDYLKSFMAAPEDREIAIHKLIGASGSKLLGFYFTEGEKDFIIIAETDAPENLIATSLAVSATGMVSDMTTLRAWTGAEFKAVGEKAGDILAAYKLPGKG